MAISGNTAIVGAFGSDEKGDFTGSAYLFDVTTGKQLFELKAEDAAAHDEFGKSVAISGNIAIIGAHNDDTERGTDAGSAYVFDVTTGSQLSRIITNNVDPGDQFGNSVAISGHTVVIGARDADDRGENAGSAYVFDVSDPEAPVELHKLFASNTTTGDQFGYSVSISGQTAIVGAPHHDGAGRAYLFDVISGRELSELTAKNAVGGDRFGWSVSINGRRAIVGAYWNDDPRDSGSAYLFDVTNGNELFKFKASDAGEGDEFGEIRSPQQRYRLRWGTA